MSLDDYEIYIQADEIGTDHTCGYCSDADAALDNIIDINRPKNFRIDVPSKKFVKEHIDSDGEVDLEQLYQYNKKHNLFVTKKRLCDSYGSGYCGCSVSTILRKAELVERKSKIKDKLLENVSSDNDSDNDTSDDYTNVNTNAIEPISNNTINNTINNRSNIKPRYYSSRYQLRCSRIPCKYHPNCKFRFSKERPCIFKH